MRNANRVLWRPLIVVISSFSMVTAGMPAVPLLSQAAIAQTTYVVPGQYLTIQKAIDAKEPLITIAPGIYKENLVLPNNASVTLRGDDPLSTIIDGDLKGTVIDKGKAKNLTVESLTITRGARSSSLSSGGGIHSADGDLILTNVIVTGNSENAGAGVVVDKGNLTITNSVVSNNVAKNNGGGVMVRSGTATIANTTFSKNRAEAPDTGAGEGGALVVLSGTVTVTSSTFDQNMAIQDGGAVWNDGVLSITGSTFTGNATQRDGGAIYDVGLGFTLTDSTVSGNTAAGKGGGIFENSATSGPASSYTRSVIKDNTAGTGGGTYFTNSSGPVVIVESTISGNRATLDGGGGIYNSTGLTLTRSTISGNTSTTRGGGVYNIAGTITGANSTISGNTATVSGGGLFESSNNGTTFNNVTVTANASAQGSGITVSAGVLNLSNSIVAGNTGSPNNVFGTFGGGGFNLTTGNPTLGPLADNGGPTFTHLPQIGSPAINTANNATCAAIDQRNVARPQGPTCDIGSVEAGIANLSISIVDTPDPVDAGTLLTYTITVTNGGPSTSSTSTVSDTLPDALSNAQACSVTATVDCLSDSGFSAFGGSIAIGSLASGASAVVKIRGTVDPSLDNVTLSNTASVSGAETDSVPSNNSAVATTLVIGAVTTVDVTSVSADLGVVGAFPSKLDIPTLAASSAALQALRQATATGNPSDASVEGSQLGAIQLGAIQLGAIQLGAIQLGAIQLGAIQLGAIQLGAIQLGAIAGCTTSDISLADRDGDGSITGDELVAFTNTYRDAPTQTVTIDDLFALTTSGSESSCVKNAIASLTLQNLKVGSSELGSLSLMSLAIGGLQLGAIDANLGDWCVAVTAQGYDCVDLKIYDNPSLLSLDLNGVQLGAIQLGAIQLGAIQLGAIQLGAIQLGAIQLGAIQLGAIGEVINCSLMPGGVCSATATIEDVVEAHAFQADKSLLELLVFLNNPTNIVGAQLGAIQLGAIQLGAIQLGAIDAVILNDLVDCSKVSCTSGTLKDVLLADAFRPGATYGMLLTALIPKGDLPWEQLPVAQVPVQVLLDASDNAQTIQYSAEFDVKTPGDNLKPGTAVVTLEDGFRYVPNTGELGVNSVEPTMIGQQLTFDLGDIRTGLYTLTFAAVPGLTLGTFSVSVGVTVDTASDLLRSAPVTVVQNFEPLNNDSAGVPIDADTLLFGHAPPSDNDYWSFVPDAVPDGSDGVYTIKLAQLGVDADLIAYGPVTPDLSPFPDRGNSLQIEPLDDRGLAIGDLTDDLDPEALQDIVLSKELLNGPWELEGLSISRSKQDESVEFFTADPLGDPLTIQVASVNHTTTPTTDEVSNSTYTLWVSTQYAEPVSCPAAPGNVGNPGEIYPALLTPGQLGALDTVFLVNRARIERHEGTAAADAVVAKLHDLVDALNGGDPELAGLGLHAAVISVEGDLTAAGVTSTSGAQIRALYADWDEDPCDYRLANLVANEITKIVKDLDTNHPLKFVTVVGSDSEIPFFRQRDWSAVSNEALYKSTFKADTALYGSSASQRFLTDDGYGDRDPLALLKQSGVLFQPDISLGRLVEDSTEIIGLIDEFIANDAQLDRSSALVTGYDFLLDGAGAVVSALEQAGLPAAMIDSLISDTWTADDLASKIALNKDIMSVEGHYDHFRSLPAKVDATDAVGTTYDTSELPAAGTLANKILFSVGCHSGLNVDDNFYTTVESLDWPQAIAQQRAVYIANTGYGYGDTDGVYYSERLMELFTEQMEINSGRSPADALRDAKQLYIGEQQQAGVYDLKVVQEATYYGLPMYQLGPSAVAASLAAVSAPGVTTTPWAHGAGVEKLDFTVNASFSEIISPEGGRYLTTATATAGSLTVTDKRPLAVHYAPIQPSISIDVTNGDPTLTARGSIMIPTSGDQGLTYTDIDPFVPVLSRPRIDLAANEGRPYALIKDIAFPSVFESVSEFNLSRTGRQQRFNAVLGQFVWDRDESSSSGVQTIFPTTRWRVLYSDSTDFEPPVALGSELFLDNGQLTFLLELTDDPAPGEVDSVVFAQAIYRDAGLTTGDASSPHTFVDLQRIPGTRQWTATVAAPFSQVRAYFQFCDENGNCGFISGKGLGLVAKLLSAGQDQVVELGQSTQPINGTFDDPTAGVHSVSVDWGDGTLLGTASSVNEGAGTFIIDPHTYLTAGVYTVTISVSDGVDFSAIDTLRVFVISPNSPPVANDDSVTTDEDTPVVINVVGNDSDPDSNLNVASVTVLSGPTNGAAVSNGDGKVTYTPNLNFNGTDSFNYRVCDFGFVTLCATATVNIVITAVNDAPFVANPIGDIVIDEDGSIPSIDLDTVFSDVEGDGLTYTATSSATSVVTTSITGSVLTLTLGTNANGQATVTVIATDGAGNVSDVFTILVNAVNDAPVADDQSVSTAEDTTVTVTLSAFDADGDVLTYSVVAGPTHGTLTGTAPVLIYTPAADYFGPDSFTFKVNDGTVDSNTATVAVTVTPVNDAPVASGQVVTTAEDTAKALVLSASDVDNDTLTYSVVAGPTHGTLTGTAPVLIYTPAADYFGPDGFTFKVNDGTVDSNTATVAITVTSVNDAPVASGQVVTTAEDSAKAVVLSASDVDGDTLAYLVVAGPTHGTLSGLGANRTYTPAADYFGPDSFTFKVNDGTVDSNTATVAITVTPVNDAPVASGQVVTTAEDTAKALVLSASDVDADPLAYSVLSGPTHGTLTGTAPVLIYTPAADYFGPDSFTFKVNDGTVDSNTATVSIMVTAVNDSPVANNQSVSTAEDTPVNLTIVASDVDSNSLVYSVVGGPSQGTLSGTAPNLTYTPAANYFGPDSFTFKANDGTADSNTATVFITVTPVTDAVLRYVGVSQLQSGGNAPLRVTVTSTDGGTVVGGTVTFAVAGNAGLGCTATVQPLYSTGALTSGTAFCNKTFTAAGTGTTYVVNATLAGTAGGMPIGGGLDTVASQRCPEGSANAAGTCNVVVFKGVQHTITGGGNLVLAASAGQYPADPGSKKNFGFNADSGKRGASLKGDINIVYLYRVPASGALVDYQLKAMDITSVGKIGILGEIISFTGTLTDLSTSVVVVPQLVLQVRLTDGDDDSDPLTVDKVSYTGWHPTDGHLLFSTNWDSTLNIPRKQSLDGGNIDIK